MNAPRGLIRRHPRIPRRLGYASALLLCATTWAWQGTTGPPPAPDPLSPPAHAATTGSLQVVWEQDLPTEPSPALDVRWASDRTIFVARFGSVTEEALDGSFTRLRFLIPEPSGPNLADRHFLPFEVLAASPEYVAASAVFRTLGFRPTPRQPRGEVRITRVPIGFVEDMDISGHQLLLLGTPKARYPEGAGIAWLGPVSAYPGSDLKPILFDQAGPRAPTLVKCADLHLGAARFLTDGSFLVIPGFQPGAHLFNPSGQLLQTWDTRSFGLDSDVDCPSVTTEQMEAIRRSHSARFEFLNKRHVLDEILPLKQGPGLVIRWVADGKVHWQVKVLTHDGKVSATYEVPFTGEPPFDRLRGDVFGDRIVLLLAPHGQAKFGPPYGRTRIVVAELAQGAQGGPL